MAPMLQVAALAMVAVVAGANAGAVRRVDWNSLGLHPRQLASTFAKYSEPVVIDNGPLSASGALSKWTPRYWVENAAPDRDVVVKNASRRVFSWGCCPQYRMSIPKLFERASRADLYSGDDDDDRREYVYFTGSLEECGAPFKNDFMTSLFEVNEVSGGDRDDSQRMHMTNVWVGSRGATTPLHHDYLHNFFVQINGVKRFTMFSPADFHSLYLFPKYHFLHRNVQLDIDNATVDDFPLSVSARDRRVVDLHPGQILYLPPLWFHQVEAASASISLNVWSQSKAINRLNKVFSIGIPLERQWDSATASLRIGHLLSLILRRVIGETHAIRFLLNNIESRYRRLHEGMDSAQYYSSSAERIQFDKIERQIDAESPPFLPKGEPGDLRAACGPESSPLPATVNERLQFTSSEIANAIFDAGAPADVVPVFLSNYVEDVAAQLVGPDRVFDLLYHCVLPRLVGAGASDRTEL
ncbi:JmjC domain-containing protein [Plasmodiophora brassicae]|uniref:JmjC domain-containing protein n=1 Tax=Plasmodiophora brassicae TaxID=37360 RepID=A0A0G4IVB0_PLABS|nr:hypothetical protein PBRA_007165 [Plasmodiophora brassicae]SPQ98606.1 unnamed protein product [Plasmodiophora brassicae]